MSHPRTRSAGSGAAGVATRATRKWGTPEVPPPETPTAQHTTTEETEAKPKPRRSRRSYTLSELEHPCFSLHGPGARIRLCTSGYSYQHWHQEGSFYAGLPASAEFEAYSKEFDCVELNGTFYGWFSEATFDKWRERALAVRPSFEYVVKVSCLPPRLQVPHLSSGQNCVLFAFIKVCARCRGVQASNMYTHKKRLNVDDFFVASWGRFWERCLRLGPTLGPVLFQFPANFKRTPTPTPKSGKRGTGALDVQPSDNLERLKALGRLLLPEGRFAFEFRDASWFHEEVYAVLREHNWCLALVDVTGAGKDDDGQLPFELF